MPGRLPSGPSGLRLANHVIGILRDAGFSNRLASYGYLLVMTYVIGFAGQETAFGKAPDNPAPLRPQWRPAAAGRRDARPRGARPCDPAGQAAGITAQYWPERLPCAL
jgi:hypothetical protein